MAEQLAVIVDDMAGWEDGCPSYEEVFFGAHHGGTYYPTDEYVGGCVLARDRAHAEEILDALNCSGDWRYTQDEDGPNERTEVLRPAYKIVTVTVGGVA